MRDPRLVVLASGSGTNLQALLDADDIGDLIVGVVSDRPTATALVRARQRGVATHAIPMRRDRAAWEQELLACVEGLSPDLVVLAGFMRVLSADFVDRWPTINVHPSLLPAFPGAHAIDDALAWGVKISGVTVHFVDELVDHGPIVAQEAVPVEPGDTPDTLHTRMQHVEHRLLPDVVRAWCAGRIHRDGRHVRIDE